MNKFYPWECRSLHVQIRMAINIILSNKHCYHQNLCSVLSLIYLIYQATFCTCVAILVLTYISGCRSFLFYFQGVFLFYYRIRLSFSLILQGLQCLTPLLAIFQLYHGRQFYWWRKPEYPENTTNLSQVTAKLYHIMLYIIQLRYHHDHDGPSQILYYDYSTKIQYTLLIKETFI